MLINFARETLLHILIITTLHSEIEQPCNRIPQNFMHKSLTRSKYSKRDVDVSMSIQENAKKIKIIMIFWILNTNTNVANDTFPLTIFQM